MSDISSMLSVYMNKSFPQEIMDQLNDPWNADPELAFYVLLSGFIYNEQLIESAKFAKQMGMASKSMDSDAVNALAFIKSGFMLAEQMGLKFPPKEGMFYGEVDGVSINKAKNGVDIFELMTDNKLLQQKWTLFQTQKMLEAKLNVALSAKVEQHCLDGRGFIPEELPAIRLRQAALPVELAKIDLEVTNKFLTLAKGQWAKGLVVSEQDKNTWFEQEIGESKDRAKKLHEKLKLDEAQILADFKALEEKYKKSDKKLSEKPNTEDKKGNKEKMATKTTTGTDVATSAPKKAPEFRNVQVMYVDDPQSHQIVLPAGMTYVQARDWLTKIETEQNRKFLFQYKFKGWYPFDAMWAMYRALAELYGFVHVADFKTMFGPQPPSSITIETEYGVKKQIPWGPIEVNNLSAPLTPGIEFDKGLPCLHLSAEVKNHERDKLDRLMERTEAMLKTDSIYRGKAVEIDFTIFNPKDIRFDVERAPRFMDTDVKESDLILPDTVHSLVDVSVWTPIRSAAACREHKIPLRRGVLLSGRYGVGKTLAARVTAMLCERNGWTFLYLRDLSQLSQALYFAKNYEPCVVFAEDVNRVVSGDRDQDMDNIFNVVDGIDRKNDEVMIIFTTNDVDQIHPGMLRPGRIDTVITVSPPDAGAASQLVRHYGRNIVDPNANLTRVGELLAGQIPAIIREAVERSKLAAIRDTKLGEHLVVKEEHLVVAAQQMLEHAKLLEEPEEPKPDMEVLGDAIGRQIASGMREQHGVDDGDDFSKNWNDKLVRKAVKEALDEAGRPGQNGKQEKEAAD